MASDIFRSIVEQKIDVFASTFGDDANRLFKRDEKLIHPLEYGMYSLKMTFDITQDGAKDISKVEVNDI